MKQQGEPVRYFVQVTFSIGGLGCVAYFLAALIPAFGLWVFNDIGLGLGLLIYLGVAVALAIPIFIAAASVSRRY